MFLYNIILFFKRLITLERELCNTMSSYTEMSLFLNADIDTVWCLTQRLTQYCG
jgi:hypothetical protein